MKRWIARLLTLAILASSLAFPAAVFAEDPLAGICASQPDSATCKSTSPDDNPLTGTDGLLYRASIVVSIVAGIVAVVMIIISGFQMIVSGGDSQKVASARKMLFGSIIGLIIIVLAQSIVLFVVGRL